MTEIKICYLAGSIFLARNKFYLFKTFLTKIAVGMKKMSKLFKKAILVALLGICFSITGVMAQAEQEQSAKLLWETHFNVSLSAQEYTQKVETSQINLNDWVALRQALAADSAIDPLVDLKYIDEVIAGMTLKLNN